MTNTTSNGSETTDTVSASNQVTLEQVRAALAAKSRDGFTEEVRALLHLHGATKLSEINPVEYTALLTEAEELANG